MAVHFTHCYPVLPVTNVTGTQKYYRDVLGFTIDWRDGESFGQVSNGDIAIFFQKVDTPTPGYVIVLNTENADAVYEAFQQAKANIVDPIQTRTWGLREFRVQDINGHVLRISHVDESQANYGTFEHDLPGD